MPTVVARAEMPTIRPDMEKSMAGANIAPPKRWIFCSMFCPFRRPHACVGKTFKQFLIVEDWRSGFADGFYISGV